MKDFTRALSSHKQALGIREKSLTSRHSDSMAESYNGLGLVYDNIGEYSTMLTPFAKALNIWRQCFAPLDLHIIEVRAHIEGTKKEITVHFWFSFIRIKLLVCFISIISTILLVIMLYNR